MLRRKETGETEHGRNSAYTGSRGTGQSESFSVFVFDVCTDRAFGAQDEHNEKQKRADGESGTAFGGGNGDNTAMRIFGDGGKTIR